MPIPYMLTKAMRGEEPFPRETKGMSREKVIELLMQPGKMKGKYLGACLDSCRHGSMTTCCWPTDIRGLMALIQKWRDENNDDESLYHEQPIDRLYKRFELPRISHPSCPRDKKHSSTFTDSAGRIRCANRKISLMKPSFIQEYSAGWDELSQMRTNGIYEEEPRKPDNSDEETGEDLTDEKEYQHYFEEKERYESEKPIEVLDVCYAIIKEPKNLALPFETILTRPNILPETKIVYCSSREPYFTGLACKRLDELDADDKKFVEYNRLCPGHVEKTMKVEFTFDGWDLAYYLLRWKQQENAPWFSERKEHWNPREHLRICSED